MYIDKYPSSKNMYFICFLEGDFDYKYLQFVVSQINNCVFYKMHTLLIFHIKYTYFFFIPLTIFIYLHTVYNL